MELKVRTKTYEITNDDPCPSLTEQGITSITVRALTKGKVAKAQAASFTAQREAYGDDYDAYTENRRYLQEKQAEIQQRRTKKERDEAERRETEAVEKFTPMQRLQASPYDHGALVLYGWHEVNGEKLPTEDVARRGWLEPLDTEAEDYVALKVATFNRLIELPGERGNA